MDAEPSSDGPIRTAEVIATLSLATDLGMSLPLEHGLQSTCCAMRLCESLGVGDEVASQTYYGCLLFYIGCTADAEIVADLFEEGALLEHFAPVMFGSPMQTMRGIMGALASPATNPVGRVLRVAVGLPRAVRGHRDHIAALCEVAQMLTDRLGLPKPMGAMFEHLTERWDGKGEPGGLRGEAVPLPIRIMDVARDATFQHMLGGVEHAAQIVGARAGHAFDPVVAAALVDSAAEILERDTGSSAWDEVLAAEPRPHLMLAGEQIDRALAAMGDFADLQSPYLVGHSAGVAELVAAAAGKCGIDARDVVRLRRAGLVHDLGRVSVPAAIWQRPAPLTRDEWEQVRLHPYHSERILCHAPFFAELAPIASHHHERLNGSGYHRGATSAMLDPHMRLLAAADAFHAMTEPRPHREARSLSEAAGILADDAAAGRLDPASVAAVVEAAGQPAPHIPGPAGLTDRECQVIALLARGMPTKQVARALGISPKTADRHVRERVREDRRLVAGCGRALRDGAWPAAVGRTPDTGGRRRLLASTAWQSVRLRCGAGSGCGGCLPVLLSPGGRVSLGQLSSRRPTWPKRSFAEASTTPSRSR